MKAGIIGVCALLALVFFLLNRQPPETTSPEVAKESPPVEKSEGEVKHSFSTMVPQPPVLSEKMLSDYAGEESSGEEDLKMMGRFLDSVFLLVKQRDTADYSTNEDLALFLTGQNSHKSPFLSKDGPALNDKNQLVDRWGSPLIVHPVSGKLLELRSAGPDKKAYTEDDLLWPDQK